MALIEDKRVISVILTIGFVLLLSATTGYSHPGGLDSSGCHHNRKTGDYHCHGGGQASTSRQSSSSQSHYTPRNWERGGTSVTSTVAKNNSVKVVGITDGDTIKVLIEGQQVKIRLYGIDAPESKQAFGRKAQMALKQITSGRKITIKTVDHDRYGRVVALVYADGMNVNEIMASSGYAWVYPQYCKESFCREWKQKERLAKANKNGLWQDGDPTPPWEWRHKR